jgi:phosphoribosylamine---glycine ligase
LRLGFTGKILGLAGLPTGETPLLSHALSGFIRRNMKILVIGSGGREHALVWKLARSPKITQMWCAPGNAGTALERLAANGAAVENVHIGAEDIDSLTQWAKDHRPELTVVGPDGALGAGVVDVFQAAGLKIWGPNKKAAQFEASKAFSQDFMEKHGIPTAISGTFSDPAQAKAFAADLHGKVAVKADGLALGKGVILCRTLEESDRAIDEILVDRAFGCAGSRVVLQEMLEGMEISLHALCDGRTAKLFPTAQDHKRAFDHDKGLNTGGMGTYSPAPFLNETELADVGRQILTPWLKGCAAEGIDFRGILYPGVMLTKGGPKVLEFNARFGDPETQTYLTRLDSDLVELLLASAEGRLEAVELHWSKQASVCVVIAAPGYPGSYPKGKEITGLAEAGALPNTKVFHAGTLLKEGKIVTNGGRVLGVTAWADSLQEARDAAYRAADMIRFEGGQHLRRDIAAKALR